MSAFAELAKGSFSGHETFTFRYPWLKKGVDGVQPQHNVFLSDAAVVKLGVGKNMVTSIRHWCLATGVIEEQPSPIGEKQLQLDVSRLGRELLDDSGWDPYLEDDATLWLLHWRLVTNAERATTWYYAFHLLRHHEFTRASLVDEILRVTAEKKWDRISRGTVEKDVSCFVRTYLAAKRGVTSTLEDTLDCPLTHLNLLQEVHGGKEERYRFDARPKPSLPPAVFAYALIEFWEHSHAKQNTLSLREITRGEGSPGRAFRLGEDDILAYLDKLVELTDGAMSFEDTSLVRQVIRTGSVGPLDILKGYYAR